MRWFPHEIKTYRFHQMEPASQKETSPLDRFAINSLPHKSSAFVPQCETMDLAYIKMIWNHVAYSALRDYVSTHCRLQGASLVTKVTTSRACSAPTNM